jgi:hypothetical protein
VVSVLVPVKSVLFAGVEGGGRMMLVRRLVVGLCLLVFFPVHLAAHQATFDGRGTR